MRAKRSPRSSTAAPSSSHLFVHSQLGAQRPHLPLDGGSGGRLGDSSGRGIAVGIGSSLRLAQLSLQLGRPRRRLLPLLVLLPQLLLQLVHPALSFRQLRRRAFGLLQLSLQRGHRLGTVVQLLAQAAQLCTWEGQREG